MNTQPPRQPYGADNHGPRGRCLVVGTEPTGQTPLTSQSVDALLPVRSPKAVADLQARGLVVAMVGDGVNDPRAGAGGTRGTITIVCRTRFPAPVAVAAWQDSEPQPELLS